MTARREASAPPRLPGYTYVRLLGLGGFADVFLYEQQLPRRFVAVKVLLADGIDDETRAAFEAEADITAQLSYHPSIVTVLHAGLAPDGRPYLVMEYCSRPGLGSRYRTERIGVDEVLRDGVRLASAVETAHRAGILHRDIKPANVLVNDLGWPALTDFGIAATVAGGGGAVGVSIPWSPPEMIAEHPHGDERSDVYSLAATLYSALAGRSPFEVPGARNDAADLVGRIERTEPAPIAREDVGASLRATLACAMSKSPSGRYPTAAELGRALQRVEAELGLPVTPLVLDDARAAAVHDALAPTVLPDDATRVRGVRTAAPVASPPAADEATRLRGPVAPARAPAAAPGPGSGAVVELPAPEQPATAAARPRRGWGTWALTAAAVVVVAVVAFLLLRPGAGTTGTPEAGPTTGDFSQSPPSVAGEPVPSPATLQGVRQQDGSVVFTWTNPEPRSGDRYLWGVRAAATPDVELELVDEPTVMLTDVPPGEVCIEVSIVREDRRSSPEPAVGCAP